MNNLVLTMTLVAFCTADDGLNCKQNPMHRDSRISGPDACEVEPHSKPWMVSVGGCGGTLIGARVVLTALHCIDYGAYVGEIVKLGVHNQSIWEVEEQRRRIQKLVSYFRNGVTNYKQEWRKVDILILILDEKVKITKDVQIAKLPRPGLKCPQNLQVCGWGRDYYNQKRSTETLWCVRQTCRPKSECDATSLDPWQKFKLCATYPARFPYNWLNSACKGDSGGPLFYTDKYGMDRELPSILC